MVTLATDTRERLSATTLGRARADERPWYARTAEPSIAHVGVGAFMRAHLAVYADDLLRQGRNALIRGASLRSPRAVEQLAPQDCYYSVAQREPGAAPTLRVIGSIASVTTGTEAALRALCAPTTRLVTLTVTEKGYDLGPVDLEQPDGAVSPPGLVARALHRWRASGLEPPVVAPLDNVAANGTVLRARVLAVAALLDPALPAWIENEVAFPNSVVDRMVPTTSKRDLDEIAARLGLLDLGAVATEAHRSWVITSDERLAAWGQAGVELVPDTTAYEQRKLWLLNGPHSALAYGGLLAGHATIASAAGDDTLSKFLRALVDDILEVARFPAALRARDFAADALRRFHNPHLGHTCAQVGADGSRKLPERFGDVVAARLQAGLGTTRFATVVALWIAAVTGLELRGARLPAVDDPDIERLRTRLGEGLDAVVGAALAGHFEPAFVPRVAAALRRLSMEGLGAMAQQA